MTTDFPTRRRFCAGVGVIGATLMMGRRGMAAGMQAMPAPIAMPDVIGTLGSYRTRYSDTLLDVARAHDLGYVEMIAANPGVDPWVPGAGTDIVLPTMHVLPDGPRKGILLNVGDMRLYHFPTGVAAIRSFPVGIGRTAWNTPLGTTHIVRKEPNPTWVVPASIRALEPDLPASVPPGPDDPLGAFALHLGWPGYLIHGTNKPYGVGRRVSHGCVRLYAPDIAWLFHHVTVGTPVTVVNQPVKIGHWAGELLLEAHPTLKQASEIDDDDRFTPEPAPGIADRLTAAAGAQTPRIDWDLVARVIRERRGYPISILKPAPVVSART